MASGVGVVKMRILIHGLAVRRHGGTARHLFNFVPALGAYGAEHEYLLFVDDMVLLPDCLPKNVSVYRQTVRSAIGRALWDSYILPRLVRELDVDVVWNLVGFGAIKSPVPQIMFQRAPSYYCHHYWTAVNARARFVLRLRRWWQYQIMRQTAHIITPTAAMREMIRASHPDLPMERFSVVPHAYNSAALEGALTIELKQMIDDLPQMAVKLLYVGHILPYKDLPFTLDVFAAAQQRSSRPLVWFLTIGKEDWPEGYAAFVNQIQERGLTDTVKILGKLPGSTIGALYRACDIVLFPSLCESFGWPMLEANSLSKPLFIADTPLNRELAGPGGCYYPTGNRSEAIARLTNLVNSSSLWAERGQMGYKHFQATSLDWQQYVENCLEISAQV